MVLLFLFIAVLLLFLNGFFVLAEFAAVKMRPSRIEELVANQVPGAGAVQRVQDHLDEFLSVCQLGITFASIGLGFVAEPAVVTLVEPIISLFLGSTQDSHAAFFTAHGIAFAISYLFVSYLHILIGELVPKTIAIRLTEAASLWTAKPLIVFRWLFYGPLRLLNGSATLVLRAMGLRNAGEHQVHSEDELRILLSESHSGGVMSFRRLLFAENVFDLGELRAKDAMRVRSQVQCLREGVSWEVNQDVIRRYRFSRYPLLGKENNKPIGIVHIKDLMLSEHTDRDLKAVSRQYLTVREDQPLEALLSEMQRKRVHVALVEDASGRWTGFLTLEDVIEEIIGTIRDEFEDEEQVQLATAIDERYVHLALEGQEIIDVVRIATMRTNAWDLPVSKEQVVKAIDDRERSVSTYLGNGLAMPHARLAGLQHPVVMFIRSEEGIPYRMHRDKAFLIFVLLTPAGQPRVHQRLQSIIATIMDESEYIPDHLRSASTPAEVIEILRTGEQASLD
jgi:CBS domain containing-hemolysin-like protein/mannitol/fructose-specific phosphotransferase system IIA component